MPSSLVLPAPAPFHSLTLAVLLGSNAFQSFFGGPIAFSALPRPAFATLQRKIFPIFFPTQALLSAALAVTYPFASRGALGGPSAIAGGVTEPVGRFAADLLGQGEGWSFGRSWAAGFITAMVLTNTANWLAVGPMTVKCMVERKHQETRDGKKSYDPGPHSSEMQRLNKKFGMLHGISSLLNLVAIGSMVAYGWGLWGMPTGI